MASRLFVLGLVVSLVGLAGCGSSSGFVPPAPTVESVSPSYGPRGGGTLVTIKGTNFTDDSSVQLGEHPLADVTLVDAQTITGMTVASDAGVDASVVVRNAGGVGVKLGVFYFVPPPLVTSVNPGNGIPAGGATVTVNGRGFVAYEAGTNAVTFAGVPATNIVTVSDRAIQCTVPSGFGVAPVAVTNANGTGTLVNGYRFFPPPTMGGVTPPAGSPLGGTVVTVTGSGFKDNAPGQNIVRFGTAVATEVNALTDTTLTCRTPGNDGTHDVSVTNANGSAMIDDAFTYFPRPTLTATNPPYGSSEGGDTITLTGTGSWTTRRGRTWSISVGRPPRT
jgi:hypothetical protein